MGVSNNERTQSAALSACSRSGPELRSPLVAYYWHSVVGPEEEQQLSEWTSREFTLWGKVETSPPLCSRASSDTPPWFIPWKRFRPHAYELWDDYTYRQFAEVNPKRLKWGVSKGRRSNEGEIFFFF